VLCDVLENGVVLDVCLVLEAHNRRRLEPREKDNRGDRLGTPSHQIVLRNDFGDGTLQSGIVGMQCDPDVLDQPITVDIATPFH
jgi:hypothetical protein